MNPGEGKIQIQLTMPDKCSRGVTADHHQTCLDSDFSAGNNLCFVPDPWLKKERLCARKEDPIIGQVQIGDGRLLFPVPLAS